MANTYRAYAYCRTPEELKTLSERTGVPISDKCLRLSGCRGDVEPRRLLHETGDLSEELGIDVLFAIHDCGGDWWLYETCKGVVKNHHTGNDYHLYFDHTLESTYQKTLNEHYADWLSVFS